MRWSLLALGLVAACGSEHSHGGSDAGFDCETDTRDEPFVAGIEKTGPGGVTVRIQSSDPAPPARGDNAWVLELEAAAAPLTGAAVEVVPFMPDHQHGSPITVDVEPGATAGEYDAAPVNLWMPGLWEIEVETTPAGGNADLVVFRFCVPA